ncbi:hypothetical protein SAQ01S_08990 [Sphingomonas aquatilis NBRC 16722]|nr:hypothetical protein SAQ01S_08990 [Sphingomonas aquatilis NBRC 16722]
MDQPVSPVKGIRERDAVNGYIVVADHNFSRARYEYLVTRRDQMQDRLRFGAMALNGASLAGLMAAMGGDGKAASWAGLSGTVALWSATAFIRYNVCRHCRSDRVEQVHNGIWRCLQKVHDRKTARRDIRGW